jgi:cupin 2 domain-containing protein
MIANTGVPAVNGGNLYEGALPPADGERFEPLLQHRNLVIERIISSATTTPTEFVQAQDEWVLLVQGTAVLDIDGATKSLKAGDYVFLPAQTPHTVKQASQGALWLAVHLHPA